STSFWHSMPNGPSASVTKRIKGPSAMRRVPSAASSPAVTAGFEFGLMTRISVRTMWCPFNHLAITRPSGQDGLAICHQSPAGYRGPAGGNERSRQSTGDHAMSTKPYDLVLRGGTVATSSAIFLADVAIEGETITAVGRDLPRGAHEIDARGRLVL